MNKKEESTKYDTSTERKHDKKDGEKNIKTRFDEYAVFQDADSDGSIALQNILMWLKQAELLGKKDSISEIEIANVFEKISKGKQRINYEEFEEFIKTISNMMNSNVKEVTKKLIFTSEPGTGFLSPSLRGFQHLEIHKNKDKREIDHDSSKEYASVFKNKEEEENK
ncbi:hypothetical protein HNY73_000670 [Argiope bruennichi]|uniref:Uncharacterized protein n=1 Tax=Argiope bruennichi TaxID=94029 RepID=A0A8T0FYU0_ARGBR|nr:hypothetical protein HNY73_000670 [Argiope bruennichi]